LDIGGRVGTKCDGALKENFPAVDHQASFRTVLARVEQFGVPRAPATANPAKSPA
jgi:hypothetical protein